MEMLYKSEGMSRGAYMAQIFISIVAGIIGVVCFFTGIQNRSLIEHLANGTTPKQQREVLFLGIILIISAVLQIATTSKMNKSKLYVYSDHIEGVSSSKWLPFARNFDFKYNQISDVKYVCFGGNRYINLFSNGVKYTVAISGNVKQAYDVVCKQIQISNG